MIHLGAYCKLCFILSLCFKLQLHMYVLRILGSRANVQRLSLIYRHTSTTYVYPVIPSMQAICTTSVMNRCFCTDALYPKTPKEPQSKSSVTESGPWTDERQKIITALIYNGSLVTAMKLCKECDDPAIQQRASIAAWKYLRSTPSIPVLERDAFILLETAPMYISRNIMTRLLHLLCGNLNQKLGHNIDSTSQDTAIPYLRERSSTDISSHKPSNKFGSEEPFVYTLLRVCIQRRIVTQSEITRLISAITSMSTKLSVALVALEEGLFVHPRIYNSLLINFIRQKNHKAWQYLCSLLVRYDLLNAYLTTTMLSEMSKEVGAYTGEDLLLLFRAEKEPNVQTYTTLIDGLARRGLSTNAMDMLREMKDRGIAPNEITYAMVAKACAISNRTHAVLQVLTEMQQSRMSISPGLFAALLAHISRNSPLQETEDVWRICTQQLGVKPDVQAFTTMISVCLVRRQLHLVKKYLLLMASYGIEPDHALHTIIQKKFPEDYALWQKQQQQDHKQPIRQNR